MKIEPSNSGSREGASGKTKVRDRRPFIIFFFCLVLASAIWLLISLSKEYRYELILPIALENLPKGKVPLEQLPHHLTVEVNATGFALLSYSLRSKGKLFSLDVRALAGSAMVSDTDRLVLPMESLLQDQFFTDHFDLQFSRVRPAQLTLSFSGSKSKRVPVRFIGSLRFAPDCDALTAPHLTPDSVTVFGSDLDLQSIACVNTNPVALNTISQSVQQRVPLAIGKLVVQPAEVQLDIPVQRYTGQSEEVTIHPIHVSEGIHVRLLPASVLVNYRLPLYQQNKAVRPIVKAEVDFKDVKTGSGKLKVLVLDVTGQAKMMKADPVYIDYIMIR